MARLSREQLEELRKPQPGLGPIIRVRVRKRTIVVEHTKGRIKIPRENLLMINHRMMLKMPSGMLLPIALLRQNNVPVVFE